MPVFDYRARNNRGEYVKGTLDADSPSAVAEQLKATGLLPLDIKVGKSTENDKPLVLSTRSERRAKNQGIKPKDIMLFSRQMSTLQKAGVPILAALQGLQDSTTKVAFIEVIRDCVKVWCRAGIWPARWRGTLKNSVISLFPWCALEK